MNAPQTNKEPDALLALKALKWVLEDGDRASRFLAITGLTPDGLRDRLDEPVLYCAVIAFLEAHEPDLIACAEAIELDPAELVAIRGRLEA